MSNSDHEEADKRGIGILRWLPFTRSRLHTVRRMDSEKLDWQYGIKMLCKASDLLTTDPSDNSTVSTPTISRLLRQMDQFLGLDASFLLAAKPDRLGQFAFYASTTKKSTPIHGHAFEIEGLLDAFKENEGILDWRPLWRSDSPNLGWQLIWKTMCLGPYAGPWEIAGAILGAHADPAGLLLVVKPSPHDLANSPTFRPILRAFGGFMNAAVHWHRLSEQINVLKDHMISDAFRVYTSGTNLLLLHNVFSAQQRQNLSLDEAENLLNSGSKSEIRRELRDARAEMANINSAVRAFLDQGQRTFTNATYGQKPPKESWSSIREVWMQISKEYAPLAANADKSLIFRTDDIQLLPIDSKSLTQILANLVHNAIKYSVKSSKIKVETSQRGRYVHLDVISYGISIRESERERIFLPGYRTQEAVRLEFNAVGLGLAAARQVAEQAGGRLYVVASDLADEVGLSGSFRNVFRLQMQK